MQQRSIVHFWTNSRMERFNFLINLALLLALLAIAESHYSIIQPSHYHSGVYLRPRLYSPVISSWYSPLYGFCGLKNPPPNVTLTAVVGGTEAAVNEIPWRCHLKFRSGDPVCGATIISSEWLMSAAHCFFDKEGKKDNLEHGGGLIVTCGDHDYLTDNEAVHVSINARRVIVHDQYNSPVKHDNDIALIQLSQGLSWTNSISPVCLPFAGEGWDCEILNSTVLASGWGDTLNAEELDNVLRKATLPCLPRKDCRDLYGESVTVTDNMICTYEPGKDTCQGDSGGSIDYETINGVHYAIGVVSFGVGCAQSEKPGVYARVTSYLDWIRQQTDGAVGGGRLLWK